ncbi:MAG: type 1 glutamine amidotransferase domain-containing protein [Thermodesulfobacteriota bacterium]
MSKIAAIITDYFEDSEFTQPAEAFREAGHEVITIGIKAGAIVKGKKEHTPVTVDRAIGDIAPDEFDALLIPGGFSPDILRADDTAVDFVKNFMETEKPVFAICHGAQLLITADTIRNRKITGYKSIIQDLKNAGADFVDQEVVVDGKLVSSRNPNDLPAFVRESLKLLA